MIRLRVLETTQNRRKMPILNVNTIEKPNSQLEGVVERMDGVGEFYFVVRLDVYIRRVEVNIV